VNALWLGAYIIIVVILSSLWSNPHDDTDPAGGRSGLRAYRDEKTGCQYVGTFGALTPRLDATGQPMCGR